MTPKEKSKARLERNKELVLKMKTGDACTSFDSQSSFFPARPVVKKDQKELKRIYGE